MRGLAWLAAPLLRGFELCTNALVKLVRLRTRPVAESVGEDEVRALIEQGLHAGVFQRAEKEMVEGVLGLDQLAVTALMDAPPEDRVPQPRRFRRGELAQDRHERPLVFSRLPVETATRWPAWWR